MFLTLAILTLGFYIFPQPVLAAWTPLIATTDFDGIKVDVLTAASGIVAILLIIVGIGLLVKVLSR